MDDAPVSLDQGILLARGLHPVSLWMTVYQQEEVALLWEGPEIAQGVIPSSNLFIRRPPNHGLQGAYYKGNRWKGPPLLVELDRAIFANAVLLEGMFSIEWQGHRYRCPKPVNTSSVPALTMPPCCSLMVSWWLTMEETMATGTRRAAFCWMPVGMISACCMPRAASGCTWPCSGLRPARHARSYRLRCSAIPLA